MVLWQLACTARRPARNQGQKPFRSATACMRAPGHLGATCCPRAGAQQISAAHTALKRLPLLRSGHQQQWIHCSSDPSAFSVCPGVAAGEHAALSETPAHRNTWPRNRVQMCWHCSTGDVMYSTRASDAEAYCSPRPARRRRLATAGARLPSQTVRRTHGTQAGQVYSNGPISLAMLQPKPPDRWAGQRPPRHTPDAGTPWSSSGVGLLQAPRHPCLPCTT